jgi:hypothetical protein
MAPAFKLVEDQLRSFFGRCCRDLSAHHGDAINHFVRPYFQKRREPMKSMDALQYHEYCGVLELNLRVSKEEKVVRLFERHIVASSLPADLRYAKDMRHKYAHLEGMGEAVSPREQFSDLVIARRAVGALTQLKKVEDTDRELIQALDCQVGELLGVLAESSGSKKNEPDENMARQQDAFASAVAERLARLIQHPAPLVEPSTVTSAAPDLHVLLTEVRKDLAQIRKQADGRQLLSRMAALEGSVLAGIRTIGEQIAASQSAAEASEDEDQTEVSVSQVDLEELLATLAQSAPVQASTRLRPRAQRPRLLTTDEAREALVALRRRIWRETGSSASSDGLLRKSLLEAFIRYRPTSERETNKGTIGALLREVAEDQREYLSDVLEITGRIEPE